MAVGAWLMYARTVQRPKQRRSQTKMFPAPVAGWISNRALALPNADGKAPQGAAILDNFFPRATSVVLRRGKQLYCTLGDGSLPALSLFSYNVGPNKRLFAANANTIYDITTAYFPGDTEIVTSLGALLGTEGGDWFGWSSTEFSDVMTGFSGGSWSVVQYATTGGVYLVGFNGQDTGFIYDGANFYPNVAGGVHRLLFDGETAAFTEGAALAGGTSGATATIYKVVYHDTAPHELWLTDLAGTFEDGEALTDDEGGEAVANGADDIASPGMTFPDGLTSADIDYAWVYKNRLWLVQKDTMNALYLEVDSIGGDVALFPLAGIFGRGGSLLFGQAWSLEGGADGGLSEQCIFVSSEGEVAVFQGIAPDAADTWTKVGLYRIGKPLGKRAFVRGGGDLAIATSIGLVPLSKAISLDITALNVATVSYPIADAWSEAVTMRGMGDWQGEIWPEQKMAVFAPPNPEGADSPVMFVSNTETGGWGRYTNWHALCIEVFDGEMYFGSPDGKVYLANSTGADDGEAYTGAVMPLFDDLGSPASVKVPKVGRAVVRASAEVSDLVEWHSDFDMTLPTAPNATPVSPGASIWGVGIWGQSTWGAPSPQVVSDTWRSLSGLGYAGTVSFQVTSGATQPLDVDLIRLEMLYDTAEAVT